MKKSLTLAALALTLTTVAAPVLRADVTPADVKAGAHEKGETIEKNTKQAGHKAKNGAKHVKNAGNNAAYKIQDEKDETKANWEKNHPNAEKANTSTAH